MLKEILKRYAITRAHPLSIISAIFLPDAFGIHIIPWKSSLLFTETEFLLLTTVASFCFFFVLDWKNDQLPTLLRSLSIIYILFVGYITTEFVTIFAGSLYAIFFEAKAMTLQLQIISDFVVIYNLGGGFIFEVYIFFMPTIVEKIQSIFRLKNTVLSDRTKILIFITVVIALFVLSLSFCFESKIC